MSLNCHSATGVQSAIGDLIGSCYVDYASLIEVGTLFMGFICSFDAVVKKHWFELWHLNLPTSTYVRNRCLSSNAILVS